MHREREKVLNLVSLPPEARVPPHLVGNLFGFLTLSKLPFIDATLAVLNRISVFFIILTYNHGDPFEIV